MLKLMEKLQAWRLGLHDTSKEAEHQKQRDEEERRACASEEELKFEREQMQMKLDFERELEETKLNQHQRLNKVNKGQQNYPSWRSRSSRGRMKNGYLFGTNFKRKSTRQA